MATALWHSFDVAHAAHDDLTITAFIGCCDVSAHVAYATASPGFFAVSVPKQAEQDENNPHCMGRHMKATETTNKGARLHRSLSAVTISSQLNLSH